MKIGFIGLGRMGAGMAHNLLRAGNELTVYNRSREKAEVLSKEGARVADSPADACSDADAVFTMLADDPAVEQVVFGEKGVASALRKNAVHISSSTISTALSRRLAAEHASRGQGYLSAPVFGRPEAAEGKKLLVVVAGERKLAEHYAPLFDAIGRQTFVIGVEPWQANTAKVCGNFMIASMMEAFAEAFATLRKADVPPHAFLEIMSTLFGSPVYSNYGRLIADGKFEPAGFALRLGLKDVRLVLQTAEECAAPMPLASLIHDQFVSAMAHGQADQDWASVAKVAARNAGLE
ncbi:MAG: NAD(P)-dependent oxidoreductase [Bryobacteraceae bacterium]|jgi:3-hydroxyisobutyrate dehydrogenase-like beta-hydroxyacid dehydrogenase